MSIGAVASKLVTAAQTAQAVKGATSSSGSGSTASAKKETKLFSGMKNMLSGIVTKMQSMVKMTSRSNATQFLQNENDKEFQREQLKFLNIIVQKLDNIENLLKNGLLGGGKDKKGLLSSILDALIGLGTWVVGIATSIGLLKRFLRGAQATPKSTSPETRPKPITEEKVKSEKEKSEQARKAADDAKAKSNEAQEKLKTAQDELAKSQERIKTIDEKLQDKNITQEEIDRLKSEKAILEEQTRKAQTSIDDMVKEKTQLEKLAQDADKIATDMDESVKKLEKAVSEGDTKAAQAEKTRLEKLKSAFETTIRAVETTAKGIMTAGDAIYLQIRQTEILINEQVVKYFENKINRLEAELNKARTEGDNAKVSEIETQRAKAQARLVEELELLRKAQADAIDATERLRNSMEKASQSYQRLTGKEATPAAAGTYTEKDYLKQTGDIDKKMQVSETEIKRLEASKKLPGADIEKIDTEIAKEKAKIEGLKGEKASAYDKLVKSEGQAKASAVAEAQAKPTATPEATATQEPVKPTATSEPVKSTATPKPSAPSDLMGPVSTTTTAVKGVAGEFYRGSGGSFGLGVGVGIPVLLEIIGNQQYYTDPNIPLEDKIRRGTEVTGDAAAVNYVLNKLITNPVAAAALLPLAITQSAGETSEQIEAMNRGQSEVFAFDALKQEGEIPQNAEEKDYNLKYVYPSFDEISGRTIVGGIDNLKKYLAEETKNTDLNPITRLYAAKALEDIGSEPPSTEGSYKIERTDEYDIVQDNVVLPKFKVVEGDGFNTYYGVPSTPENISAIDNFEKDWLKRGVLDPTKLSGTLGRIFSFGASDANEQLIYDSLKQFQEDNFDVYGIVPEEKIIEIRDKISELTDSAKGTQDITEQFSRGIPQYEETEFNKGGLVPGPESVNKDVVPAMLTPGEFVLNKQVVGALGAQTLYALNEGKIQKLTTREAFKLDVTKESNIKNVLDIKTLNWIVKVGNVTNDELVEQKSNISSIKEINKNITSTTDTSVESMQTKQNIMPIMQWSTDKTPITVSLYEQTIEKLSNAIKSEKQQPSSPTIVNNNTYSGGGGGSASLNDVQNSPRMTSAESNMVAAMQYKILENTAR